MILGQDLGLKLMKVLGIPDQHLVRSLHLHCEVNELVTVIVEYFPSEEISNNIEELLTEYTVQTNDTFENVKDGWTRYELVKKV